MSSTVVEYVQTYKCASNEIQLQNYKAGSQTLGRFPTLNGQTSEQTDTRDALNDVNDGRTSPTSGRFPTLSILTELQLKFGKDPAGDTADAQHPPQPFASRRRKEELFSAGQYDASRGRSEKPPQLTDSWESLSKRLFELSSNNLDRVRAAFCFACTDWQLEPYDQQESQTYKDVRRKRHIKVFQKLLISANVPFVRIEGNVKSADIEPGQKHERENGVWHACYVAGERRFVDVHWGAASVKDFNSGRYREIASGGSLAEGNVSKGEDKPAINEFFFLTDPEKFIVSHFPVKVKPLGACTSHLNCQSVEAWQLLCKPLTKEEFEQMPHYFDGSEHAMKHCYQLEPLNCPRNVILAGQGPVEIFFKSPTHVEALSKLDFAATLRIYNERISDATKDAIRKAGGTRPNCVTVERLGQNEDVVWLTFHPPCAGKFALTVKLRRNESCQHWCRFLTYIVHCPELIEKRESVPPEELLVRPTTTTTTTTPAPVPPTPTPVPPTPTPVPPTPLRLNVTRESLAELRSYPKPPDMVFKAVQAILLMLGFYEKRSRKWYRCQPLITAIPQAVEDLVVSSIDPRIAARSRKLIESKESPGTELSLASLCPAAYEFYKWVDKTTKLIEDATPKERFVPADVEQQKIIFCTAPEEDAHWDWEDSRIMSTLAHNFIGFCDVCHVAVYSDDLKMHLHCCVSRRGRHTARV